MMFREKPINKLYAFALAAVFALTLVGCGGGGGGSSTATTDDTMVTQQSCEAGGGRWNDDMSCTSAADLAAEKLAMERDNIKMKITAAQSAVGAVDNESTPAQVSAADAAIMAAKAAIAAAENVPAEEKAANTLTVTGLESQLTTAKENRMAAMDAAKTAADKAMMATAMKLHTGIGTTPFGTATSARTGAYNDDGDAINVTIGAADAVELSEDKNTRVPDNHGWAGKKYKASPTGGGMYEAVVYSNVDDPTEGKKFGSAAAVTADGAFQYQLTEGELSIDTTATGVPGRVASTRFTQTAGTKKFELPEPNPLRQARVEIPGRFHGVSGTYYCAPTTGETCTSTVAGASSFTLTGGTWTFKPTNPNARVTESRDTEYASYGWWIHKPANGDYVVSAFADDKGDVLAASGIAALAGKATYMGGAAGKYALYSATGGTNDAGHFTARATLEADFNTDMITGTIDQFMGADGMSRDWSVELKKSTIGDTGPISSDGTADAAGNETVWTIGGTAAAAAGEWSGALKDNGTDTVPKVATGTFHSTYSTSGRMVGAFGARKQ